MFDTKKFGAFVALKRKNADLTQAELAEKLNLTRQAISRYERGDSFPDISILVQIAEIFELSLDALIGSGNPIRGENQFLKDNDILRIINGCRYDFRDDEGLEKIFPFLDVASKEVILKKIIEGALDWHLIKVLLPHMQNMAGQLEAAVMDGALPNGALEIMQEYFLKERVR